MSTDTDPTQWVRDRLNQDHVVSVAHGVRMALLQHGGTVEVSYAPGDMTVYGLVFTRLDDSIIRVGDRPTWIGVGVRGGGRYLRGEGWVQVALVNWGRVHVFQLLAPEGSFLHPSTVQEHLCDNEASSIALAELLNRIALTEW